MGDFVSELVFGVRHNDCVSGVEGRRVDGMRQINLDWPDGVLLGDLAHVEFQVDESLLSEQVSGVLGLLRELEEASECLLDLELGDEDGGDGEVPALLDAVVLDQGVLGVGEVLAQWLLLDLFEALIILLLADLFRSWFFAHITIVD